MRLTEQRMVGRVFSAMLFLLSSCSVFNTTTDVPHQPASSGIMPGFGVAQREMRKDTGDCARGGCARIHFSYIEFVGGVPELRQKINRRIQDSILNQSEGKVAPSVNEFTSDYFAQFREMATSDPQFLSQPTSAWSIDRSVKVFHWGRGVLTLEYTEQSYLGGVHSNSVRSFVNIDMQSGEVLSLSQILTPGKEREILVLAEEQFRKVRGLTSEQNLKEAGFEFAEGVYSLTNNFACARDGLVFYYDEYEIASYSDGPTEIKLSYETLRGLVKPEMIEAITSPVVNAGASLAPQALQQNAHRNKTDAPHQ